MLSALMLVSALVATEAGRLDTQIRAVDGSVTIHAQAQPLSQILDRLATATGMVLTYEGPRPSNPITMTADGLSETEAILRLMEGVGVSYVLRMDKTGQRVDTMIVSGAGAGRPSSSAPATRASAASEEPAYEEPVGDYGQIPLDPAVVEAAGPQTKPDLNSPYLGLPAQHFPPGLPQPPVAEPSNPQGPGYRNPASMPITPPSYPTGSSYPNR